MDTHRLWSIKSRRCQRCTMWWRAAKERRRGVRALRSSMSASTYVHERLVSLPVGRIEAATPDVFPAAILSRTTRIWRSRISEAIRTTRPCLAAIRIKSLWRCSRQAGRPASQSCLPAGTNCPAFDGPYLTHKGLAQLYITKSLVCVVGAQNKERILFSFGSLFPAAYFLHAAMHT